MNREQFNVRLPGMTIEQIDLIAETHGLTKTQIVILAIDRLAHQVNPESINAPTRAAIAEAQNC